MNLTQLPVSQIRLHLTVSDPKGRLGSISAVKADSDGVRTWVNVQWQDGEQCELLTDDAGFLEIEPTPKAQTHPAPAELSWGQCVQISHLLMDSKAQAALIGNSQAPNIWMLDYMYDSSLRQRLERRMQELSAS